MHRLVAATAVLLLVVAACSDDSASNDSSSTDADSGVQAPDGQLSVLTYNVAGLPEGISGSSPEANSPIISPLLNDYDLVLLQEDFDFYNDVIRADADHANKSEPHPGADELNPIDRESAGVGDGLNIFSRYEMEPLDRVPWQGCGDDAADCLALKGFAKTVVELPDGASFDLYTLHAEAGGNDDALRQDDLDELAAYLAQESVDRPVIIGGDWNLHTDEEPDATQFADFLEQTGLIDVCSQMDCEADADVIDKIVYRNGEGLEFTPTSHVFERARFADAAGEPLSDHDPLHVDFDWTVTG